MGCVPSSSSVKSCCVVIVDEEEEEEEEEGTEDVEGFGILSDLKKLSDARPKSELSSATLHSVPSFNTNNPWHGRHDHITLLLPFPIELPLPLAPPVEATTNAPAPAPAAPGPGPPAKACIGCRSTWCSTRLTSLQIHVRRLRAMRDGGSL
jgi:hypothetical protein